VRTAPVLVVDDDKSSRDLLSMALQLEGFGTVTASNGLEALTYLRSGGAASLILLDLMMPVMDGFAFRQQQRQDSRLANIPIVLVSTVANEHASALQPAAALDKPVDVFRVVDLVRSLPNEPAN
jgi:CheY-like chemotaxis protein